MNPANDRRDFLRTVVLATSLACAPKGGQAATDTPEALPVPTTYQSLGPAEAAFVERMVDAMCPADDLTPAGTSCGLALFIDRQLAGAFGRGERLYLRGPWRPGRPEHGYQLPLTPEQFFKAGLGAADELCEQRHGKRFADLEVPLADAFLAEVANGVAHPRIGLGEWFNELVYPLFQQACFSDPTHGGNRDKVFWRMIGYPGLPAVHGINMVQYRGKPFPGAARPLSMDDFG